jgi:hypothetical protein
MQIITLTALSLFSLLSCGALTTEKPQLKLRVYGITEAAGDGTLTPRSAKITLKSITLTPTQGDVITVDIGAQSALTIIDRPQLVFHLEDASSLSGKDYNRAEVTLNPEISLTSKNDIESKLTLKENKLTAGGAMKFEDDDTSVLTIRAAWGKTITENQDGSESATEPKLKMVVGE